MLSFGAHAQRLITGKTLDIQSREPIDQVDVAIFKGTQITTTNSHGYFQLNVNEGDSLLITHPDYKLGLIPVPEVDVFIVYMEKVDMYPVYLDGDRKLFMFIQQNLKYPAAARRKRVEGVLLIHVLVDQEGNISNCLALNELGGNCAKETLEVFNKIPGKWSSSMENSSFIFPVIFQFSSQNEKHRMPAVEIPEGKMMPSITVTVYNASAN